MRPMVLSGKAQLPAFRMGCRSREPMSVILDANGVTTDMRGLWQNVKVDPERYLATAD